MKNKEVKGLENLKKHYKIDGVVSNYEKLRFLSLSGRIQHKRETSIVNSFIKKLNPNLVLEVATGPGRITKDIKISNKAIGIDSSEGMIREAKRVSDNNWSFLVSDVMKMPFEKEKFDMVYTFRLIPHFKKDERKKSYKEINRVLKKKGCFIMNVGNRAYVKPKIVKLIVDFYHFFKPIKKQKYLPKVYNVNLTSDEIKEELGNNNFSVKKIYGINLYNTFNLLLFALSRRVKIFDKFIEKYIHNVEDKNQLKLNNYAEFIIICEKNGKHKKS